MGDDGARKDGTFTFLFTDIEGSTGLWQRDPEGMRVALERHDNLLREISAVHGGDVFKTIGDAFCVAFPNARAALDASLLAQKRLQTAFNEGLPVLKVRMSLHTGDAQQRDNDYFGLSLAKVARLLGGIHGGQIALTAATAALLRDALPPDSSLRDLGEHLFRGFDAPERVFQVFHPDLPADFPPIQAMGAPKQNLPRQLTQFIGREREVGEIKRLVALSPLVTLTGPGGAGKTRLALQSAETHLSNFPDGVWFADLSALTDSSQIPQAIASALGFLPQPGRDAALQIASHLSGMHLLLVLDNCEHLVAECAELAECLLQASARLRILATSREGLGIPGETIFPVPPLSLPPQDAGLRRLMQSEAARLFLDRARTIAPAFRVTSENAKHIASICRRLDGIPLALLITASWLGALAPAQVEQRLTERLLKATSSRTAQPRHQTLQATLDWSYALLSEGERTLLRRVSVFAGGWTLEAAEAVCGNAPVEDVLDVLFGLIRKSLVTTDSDSGETRYRLLEPVRQYAHQLLKASGEEPSLLRQHRDFYLNIAEQAAPHLTGAESTAWMDCLAREHDNLRAALTATEAACEIAVGQRFIAALFWYWYVRGHFQEGRRWVASFLLPGVAGADIPTQAKAENGAGILAWGAGDLDAARAHYEQSRTLYESLGDLESAAKCLNNLGMVASLQNDLNSAQTYFEESLARYRSTENRSGKIAVLCNLANNANRFHEADATRRDMLIRALTHLKEALNLQREGGNSVFLAGLLHNLAIISHKHGEITQAYQYFTEALSMQRELGHQAGIAELLDLAPTFALRADDLNLTCQLLGASEAFRNSIGVPRKPDSQKERTGIRTYLANNLEQETLSKQESLGSSWNLDDIREHFQTLIRWSQAKESL